MNRPHKKWRALMAGALMRLTPVTTRPEKQRLIRMDFGASAQRMGIRMNERIRSVWRRQWLRLKPAPFETQNENKMTQQPLFQLKSDESKPA